MQSPRKERAKWPDGKANKEGERNGRKTTNVFLPRKERRASGTAQRVGIWCPACSLSLIPREKTDCSMLSQSLHTSLKETQQSLHKSSLES